MPGPEEGGWLVAAGGGGGAGRGVGVGLGGKSICRGIPGLVSFRFNVSSSFLCYSRSYCPLLPYTGCHVLRTLQTCISPCVSGKSHSIVWGLQVSR